MPRTFASACAKSSFISCAPIAGHIFLVECIPERGLWGRLDRDPLTATDADLEARSHVCSSLCNSRAAVRRGPFLLWGGPRPGLPTAPGAGIRWLRLPTTLRFAFRRRQLLALVPGGAAKFPCPALGSTRPC